MNLALCLVATVAVNGASASGAPSIENDTRSCFVAGSRPRVCAHIMDTGTVVIARVYFRARQSNNFYWTDLAFDGSRYCATLPALIDRTTAVEYYVKAINDQYEPARTRTLTVEARPDCPEPLASAETPPTVVHATSPRPNDELLGFESATFKVAPLAAVTPRSP